MVQPYVGDRDEKALIYLTAILARSAPRAAARGWGGRLYLDEDLPSGGDR
jgi:hypothetical protein